MSGLAYYHKLGRQLEQARKTDDTDRIAKLRSQLLTAPEVIRYRYVGDVAPRTLAETPPPPADQLAELLAHVRGVPVRAAAAVPVVAGAGGRVAGAAGPLRIAEGEIGASTATDRRAADPDADVARVIAAGDRRAALVLLMQRHGVSVHRFCRCALRDAALAADVQQQVFLQAYCDLASFAGRSSVRTWLFAIARNRVLDAAKLRKRAAARFGADGADDAADSAAPPGERIDDARVDRALLACVAELAEPVRTAILLRYQSGFSFEEMAEICGEKAGTLQARVARALPVLRAQVERRCGGTL